MYHYKAQVVKVIDGDTIDFMVDLGFGTHQKIRVRLARVDAWEKRGEEKAKGDAAKEYVEKTLSKYSWVEIRTFKDRKGKYGRYIAEVFLPNGHKPLSLGDMLLKEGHAKIYGS